MQDYNLYPTGHEKRCYIFINGRSHKIIRYLRKRNPGRGTSVGGICVSGVRGLTSTNGDFKKDISRGMNRRNSESLLCCYIHNKTFFVALCLKGRYPNIIVPFSNNVKSCSKPKGQIIWIVSFIVCLESQTVEEKVK